jgi:hypothetical protein
MVRNSSSWSSDCRSGNATYAAIQDGFRLVLDEVTMSYASRLFPTKHILFELALTLYLDLQIRAPTRLMPRAQRQALPVEPGCR